MTVAAVEATGLAEWLAEIRTKRRSRSAMTTARDA
jgi:hypothetical protein